MEKVLVVDIGGGYDPRSAFTMLDEPYPVPWPDINNLIRPSDRVLEKMDTDLRQLATEFDVVYWMHGRNCYPELKDAIRKFKLAVLFQGDDGPESSEHKTFPIATSFDVLLYTQLIWSMETGERTADKYKERGLEDCRHVSLHCTDGIEDWFATGKRVQDRDPYVTLAWVGLGVGNHAWSNGPGWRGPFLKEVNARVWPFSTRLHGLYMRDGVLGNPESSPGRDVAALYMDSKCGFNCQQVSIYNVRFNDYLRCGTLQFIYDPWNELDVYGFEPFKHFIPYDGTVPGLEAAVIEHGLNPDPRIIENGYLHVLEFIEKHDVGPTMARVLEDYR